MLRRGKSPLTVLRLTCLLLALVLRTEGNVVSLGEEERAREIRVEMARERPGPRPEPRERGERRAPPPLSPPPSPLPPTASLKP